jgi:hypothetical protein
MGRTGDAKDSQTCLGRVCRGAAIDPNELESGEGMHK